MRSAQAHYCTRAIMKKFIYVFNKRPITRSNRPSFDLTIIYPENMNRV